MRSSADFDWPRTVISACRLVLAELAGDERGRDALFVELLASGPSNAAAVIGFFVGATADGLRGDHGTTGAIDVVTALLGAAVLAAADIAETP
jgi:hypothetical protein